MNRSIYDHAFDVIQSSIGSGIMHLTTEETGFCHNYVNINGKTLLNFSLCDYLSLSQDERVKHGAIKAIEKFGVYTAISRTYIKLKIYEEAEDLLARIFDRPVLIFPRTTLTHLGILPVLVNSNDAVILDHQVHTSVRLACDLIKGNGVHIETIRHNDINALEDRIKALRIKHRKIWYLADGVYSMYGDTISVEAIKNLAFRYEQFSLYVDDAHGMSWRGKNGRGFLLNALPYTENMVVTTSLGKGFGAGGGIVVCYDKKMRDYLETCAPPLIFTSPVTPPTLGAIVESAKIHLSDEIDDRQKQIEERIFLFNSEAKKLDLPVISGNNTPIAFIATGKPDMCREICFRLMEKGYYVSASHFPAVPINNSGIRVVISLYHTKEDILSLVEGLNEEYNRAINRRGLSTKEIIRHYKIS